jgi:hypothetical protein
VAPVTCRAWSEARNATAAATSSGCPKRFIGTFETIQSSRLKESEPGSKSRVKTLPNSQRCKPPRVQLRDSDRFTTVSPFEGETNECSEKNRAGNKNASVH